MPVLSMPDQEMPVLSMPVRLRRDTQSSPCLPTHATAVSARPRRSRPAGPRHCNLAVPAMPRNLTIRAKPAIPGRAAPEHSHLALPAPPMRARPCPSLRRHACPANPGRPRSIRAFPAMPCLPLRLIPSSRRHACPAGSSRSFLSMPASNSSPCLPCLSCRATPHRAFARMPCLP